jgi:hypothetical protein
MIASISSRRLNNQVGCIKAFLFRREGGELSVVLRLVRAIIRLQPGCINSRGQNSSIIFIILSADGS